MNIGVDIDEVCIDSSYAWWKYLEMDTKKGLKWEDVKGSYDIASHYKEELWARGLDGLDFWRRRNTYDDLVPQEGCVEALQWIQGFGNKIVFISSLKGNHHKSKVGFVKRYFPFYDAFLGTKEKEFVNVQVMIDDSNHVLNRFDPENVVLIKYDNEVKQPHELKVDVNIIHSWKDIYAYESLFKYGDRVVNRNHRKEAAR